MRPFFFVLALFPVLGFTQNYTQHTTAVKGDTLFVYQHASWFHAFADTYYIDSVQEVRTTNTLALNLFYTTDTALAGGLATSGRLDTLTINNNPIGNSQLIVNSFNFFDSLWHPGYHKWIFDTLIFKHGDTSYFQILNNPAVNFSLKIEMYPNPAKESVHFSGLSQEPVEVIVINTSGQKVLATVIEINKPDISLEGLPSGIYQVQFKLDKQVLVRELLIE